MKACGAVGTLQKLLTLDRELRNNLAVRVKGRWVPLPRAELVDAVIQILRPDARSLVFRLLKPSDLSFKHSWE